MAEVNLPPPGEPPLTEADSTAGRAEVPPLARPLSPTESPPDPPINPPWPEPAGDLGSSESVVAATGVVTTISSVFPTSPVAAPAFTPDADDPAGIHTESADPYLVDISPVVRESPPWLISAVVHMLLLILFGLLFAARTTDPHLRLDAVYSEKIGEQLLEENLELAEQNFELDEQLITPDDLPEVEDPLATPAVSDVAPLPSEATAISIPTTIGMALSGRTEGRKQALLKAYGGTASTEAAVMAGLEWLARQQLKNGLWSLQHPYDDGGQTENYDAATAMALLAFQGAGFTHNEYPSTPFQPVVARGWKALLRRQQSDGRFFDGSTDQHRFYTHALCTIALCELYAMTGDKPLHDPAQNAVNFLVRTQRPEGGWRYYLEQDNDLSVTGWVVMALQSARMAGLEVPSETLERVRKFLDTVAKDGGRTYAYQPQLGPGLAMTAEGLLCRQYLGWEHDDPRLQGGADQLLANPPSWDRGQRNVYYWYYGTQVCHHMEGHWWKEWNAIMREMLPAQQEKQGRERGSWDPTGDRYGTAGGRLYTTCLSIYILEVYYRHLPIYDPRLIKQM